MMLTFIVAAVAVALMVVGLSITLMRKGRNIQTDVGSNDDMKRLGIDCTLEQMGGVSCASNVCGVDGTPASCASCGHADSCVVDKKV